MLNIQKSFPSEVLICFCGNILENSYNHMLKQTISIPISIVQFYPWNSLPTTYFLKTKSCNSTVCPDQALMEKEESTQYHKHVLPTCQTRKCRQPLLRSIKCSYIFLDLAWHQFLIKATSLLTKAAYFPIVLENKTNL